MRAFEFIREGGWDTTATQSTVIKPAIVKVALKVIDKFTSDFNEYLEKQGLGPVRVGRPTGSSTYYQKDIEVDPEKIYGDIDLQMIGPPLEVKSQTQYAAFWNKLAKQFVDETHPDYVLDTESEPGHPIIKIGDDAYVQVDLMWHEESMKDWGAARVTPEHGVKGLLAGNMYSVLGQLLDMSIQHAGVQYKSIDGVRVPFSKQKGTTINTISTNPKTWILDIFNHIADMQHIENPKIDSSLSKYPGTNIDNVKISDIVNGVKGLAKSFEDNNMFGQGILEKYNSANDFISKFIDRYEEKAMADVMSKKREKASTPQAIERAEQDRKSILQGLEKIKGYF